MEDPTMLTYPWGKRHEANGSLSESVLPRDNSLAEIAPWTMPSQPESSQPPNNPSQRRNFGISSFASTSRLRHGSNAGASSTVRGVRRSGDSDASQSESNGADTFDATPQKAGKSSFLNFIKKKASRPTFHREMSEVERFATLSSISFDGDPLASNISLSSSGLTGNPHDSGFLRPPQQSKRSRKASTKNKQSIPPQDTYMQLDINQLDMEGIIDPRVNISNNQPTTNGSPIDITRAPWDMPSTSQIGIAPRSRSQAGPSGSAGGIAGTPFSTLNPFGSPPHPTSRNGKSRALSSISPKDTLPTTSPFDVERYAVRDTSPHLIPGSSTPAALYPIDTDVHQNPHSQPVSPHWQAPDSWATIPPESERLDGAGESSDEDAGNTTTRRPSFAPIADAPTSGSGTVRKSPSQTLNARAREKSLPQTPITSGLDGGFGKPTQTSVRIYRSDGKYHVVNCPPNTTVAQMRSALTKKLGIKGETHRLYMREKGRQRALGLHQAPALILHRRLEQAGYTPADELEALGGEDLGFLVRFIFRNASLGVVEVDKDSFPNGFEHIELAERGLETVPIVLHRHAGEIVTLNLSKNPLVDIPQDFVADCLSLRELRLTNVAMKRIPRAVRLIKSLQWLDISCNRIVELDHAGLEQIPGLRQIFVQNNRLTNLPRSFAHTSSLKFLNISNNKFDEIPPVICDMPYLVDLDVSFNSISILPPGIGKLIGLERLIIVGNQIQTFPPEMRLMISLRELDCRRNLISDLSPLSSLPRLASLLAEHNMVNILDFVVGPKLVTLNTSHNRTAKSMLRPLLPNTRFSLTILDLSHLKLSSFDEDGAAFAAFTSLTNLKLDYNEFRSVPEVICALSDLEVFSCTNNDLHDLPPNIGNLRKLRTFNVHNNNIKVVPEGIWECESLVELNMSSNSLEGWMDPVSTAPSAGGASLAAPADDMCDTDGTERKGSAAGLSFTSRSSPPLANSLQRLLLADNYLGVQNRTTTFDIFRTLSYMRELRVLNLSFNQLNELPPLHLQGFAQLHELYLSGNNLTSLPGETMQKLLKLKVLHLNGNKLQTLPAELGKVAGLETLDVGNNQLKYNVLNWQYDWNWNFNSQLKYLNLSGNKRLEIKNLQQALPSTTTPAAAEATPRLFDFADLAKLRVLGLMDVTLRGASVPDESFDRRVRTSETEINGMAYGIADTLGTVDGPMTFDLALQKFRGQDNECLFGMFGRTQPHISSNRVAKYLHEHLPRSFIESLSRSLDKSGPSQTEDVPESLRTTFLNLNRNLYEHLATKGYDDNSGRKLSTISMSGPVGNELKSGASAVVIYIVDRPQAKMMYVANVGDMLAVVSQSNGSFAPVSNKHDPFERSEIVRIRAAEGWVSPKGMVNEEEDLSRNFGLYHLLPAVNARPDIHPHVLSDLDEFVIVGNRGLWDYVSYRTAVDIARLNREDPMKAAQMLRDYAMSYGADGNTVIMVIAVGDLFPGGGRSRNPQDDNPFTYVPIRRTGPRPERDRLLRMLDESVTPPNGLLSLVFTDIRNSTSLWEKNVGMPLAMKAHNELLRRQARWIGGYEVKTEGDSFMMAFQTLPAALLWCFKVQTELLDADWPMEILESEEGAEIRDPAGDVVARGLSVRMGIHWGKPVCAEDPTTHRMDYFGPMVNRSARIMSQALGGQIMVSSDVVREIERMKEQIDNSHPSYGHFETLRRMGIEITFVGERALKGLEAPEALSLVLPTALRGRLETPTTPAPAPSSRIQFSVNQLMELSMLTVRLEALATSRVFKAHPPRRSLPSNVPPIENPSSAPPATDENNPVIWRGNPDVVMPNIKNEPTDQDLLMLLDHITGRIENALSSLQIRSMMQSSASMGPPPHLEDIDSQALAQALRILQGFMSPITRGGRIS